jgi:hypothetical protein
MTSWLARATGEFAESLRLGDELVRVGRDGADQQVWGWGLVMVGSLLRLSGAMDEAAGLLQRAGELLLAVPDYLWLGIARGELSQCLLRQAKTLEAIALLEETNTLVTQHGVNGYFCWAVRNGLAEAYLTALPDAGGAGRADALARARQACDFAIKEGQRDHEGLPGALRLRGTYEWLGDNREKAREWWQKSLTRAGDLGMPHEQALTHIEIGKRAADREHLEQAEVLFGDIRRQLGPAMARSRY